ncbi:MAG: 50S ribosomal protein L32 [Bifidobacterium psychraerophilum]|uniref:50S ribosomal protein L32 n=1 Tax=Bifidobacterium psychraerophilum TaxID=218140 RepID=UPI0039EB0926
MALPKYKKSRANTHARRAQWKAHNEQIITVSTPDASVVEVPQHLAAAARKGLLKL